MEWFNDPWVIGIGGGILSGLIVTGVSRWLFSGRDRRELSAKITSANREVVYSIRQGIPEDRVPTREIVEALISSTARKYSIPPTELNQPEEVAADLVKEVMDSSFISAEKKEQYCASLLSKLVAQHSGMEAIDHRNLSALRTIANKQRANITWMMSATLGMAAAGMSIGLAFFGRDSAAPYDMSGIVILLPSVVVLSAAIMALLLSRLERYRRRARDADTMERMLVQERDEIFPDVSKILATVNDSGRSLKNGAHSLRP